MAVPVPSNLHRGWHTFETCKIRYRISLFNNCHLLNCLLRIPLTVRFPMNKWVGVWGIDSVAKTKTRMNFLLCNRNYFHWNKTGTAFPSEILGFYQIMQYSVVNLFCFRIAGVSHYALCKDWFHSENDCCWKEPVNKQMWYVMIYMMICLKVHIQ